MLFDDLREQTSNVFKHALIANMYGSEEMNGIAIECPFHNMHVISENVYVEYRRCFCLSWNVIPAIKSVNIFNSFFRS